MGYWVTEPAQKDRPHTIGYDITISAFATIINIALVSGGLTQHPISPPERTLRFQREDMGS